MNRHLVIAAVLFLGGLVFYLLSTTTPPGITPQGETATPQQPDPSGSGEVGQEANVGVGSHPLDIVLQPWRGDLDGMIERRVIRILTVYSTGYFYLEGGRERGITKEFSTRFEQFINRHIGGNRPRVYIALIPVARNELIPGLLSGRGDLAMAGLTITPGREQQVDFSIPVSETVNEILVTGPSAPLLSTTSDLAGETVYVRRSSSYRESLERLSEELVREGSEPVDIEYVDESLEDEDLIEMVDAGLLPWAVVDDYKAQMWGKVFTDMTVRDDIVLRSGARVAWAFRPDSPELAAAVNAFLERNRQGTLVGNVLIGRYIIDAEWADNALAGEHLARFESLLETFRKYGQMYDIDHLLLAAQGYQESRLDQSARSSAGAIGIMQLQPATAADPNVGIPNIEIAENNIHAGAKYVDFLRSRYFNDADMDPLNRVLMSLAAYNVGPGRMIELRNRASELGYDPNIWFDNVELVAATDIGQEPVRYVARIFKYYLAYRYAMETLARREAARRKAGIG